MGAIDKLNHIGLDSDQKWQVAAALEEYEAKLQTLQQEYDKLRDVHYDLRNQHESLDKAAIRQNELIINLQEQYDNLKGENERLRNAFNVSETAYKAASGSYLALTEKAEKMAQALKEIEARYPRHYFAGITAYEALSSYNSQTNQNENNG